MSRKKTFLPSFWSSVGYMDYFYRVVFINLVEVLKTRRVVIQLEDPPPPSPPGPRNPGGLCGLAKNHSGNTMPLEVASKHVPEKDISSPLLELCRLYGLFLSGRLYQASRSFEKPKSSHTARGPPPPL